MPHIVEHAAAGWECRVPERQLHPEVTLRDQHWGARLIEGEPVFDAPANSCRPFVVETVLVRATAALGMIFGVRSARPTSWMCMRGRAAQRGFLSRADR